VPLFYGRSLGVIPMLDPPAPCIQTNEKTIFVNPPLDCAAFFEAISSASVKRFGNLHLPQSIAIDIAKKFLFTKALVAVIVEVVLERDCWAAKCARQVVARPNVRNEIDLFTQLPMMEDVHFVDLLLARHGLRRPPVRRRNYVARNERFYIHTAKPN
jgi:hypothetical protein